MKKFYCMTLMVFLMSLQIIGCQEPSNMTACKEESKNGIVFINNEPSYFNFQAFNGFFATEKWIKKHNGALIKAGRISKHPDPNTGKYFLYTYMIKDDPYSPDYNILGEKYLYKVEKCKAYVSIDGKEWDQLVISNVDLSKRYSSNAEIYATFFLKCKWFEGEYNFEMENY